MTDEGGPTKSPGVEEQLKILEGRSFKTYSARQFAAARLRNRSIAWNWALVAFSTSTTIASIGMLTKPGMYGHHGDTLLVCLAVLSLVTSLTTANMDYSGRSRDMFLNYRRLQRLATEVETRRLQQTRDVDQHEIDELNERYQSLLDESENHTTNDYLRHLEVRRRTTKSSSATDQSGDGPAGSRWLERVVTFLPYATLAVPLGLVARFAYSLFWA